MRWATRAAGAILVALIIALFTNTYLDIPGHPLVDTADVDQVGTVALNPDNETHTAAAGMFTVASPSQFLPLRDIARTNAAPSNDLNSASPVFRAFDYAGFRSRLSVA